VDISPDGKEFILRVTETKSNITDFWLYEMGKDKRLHPKENLTQRTNLTRSSTQEFVSKMESVHTTPDANSIWFKMDGKWQKTGRDNLTAPDGTSLVMSETGFDPKLYQADKNLHAEVVRILPTGVLLNLYWPSDLARGPVGSVFVGKKTPPPSSTMPSAARVTRAAKTNIPAIGDALLKTSADTQFIAAMFGPLQKFDVGYLKKQGVTEEPLTNKQLDELAKYLEQQQQPRALSFEQALVLLQHLIDTIGQELKLKTTTDLVMWGGADEINKIDSVIAKTNPQIALTIVVDDSAMPAYLDLAKKHPLKTITIVGKGGRTLETVLKDLFSAKKPEQVLLSGPRRSAAPLLDLPWRYIPLEDLLLGNDRRALPLSTLLKIARLISKNA
jgi:hypothetical protein